MGQGLGGEQDTYSDKGLTTKHRAVWLTLTHLLTGVASREVSGLLTGRSESRMLYDQTPV